MPMILKLHSGKQDYQYSWNLWKERLTLDLNYVRNTEFKTYWKIIEPQKSNFESIKLPIIIICFYIATNKRLCLHGFSNGFCIWRWT